jgi:hypothetical protein
MRTLLCLTAAIVTLTGCGLDSEPIWLVMTVDKTLVAMDDSVRVTLVVTNTGDRSVTTHDESEYGLCLPGFEVVDEEGRAVHMNVVCTLESRTTITLAPGEMLQTTTWWYPGISRVGDTPVAPGIYTIRGAVQSDNQVVRSGTFDILLTE